MHFRLKIPFGTNIGLFSTILFVAKWPFYCSGSIRGTSPWILSACPWWVVSNWRDYNRPKLLFICQPALEFCQPTINSRNLFIVNKTNPKILFLTNLRWNITNILYLHDILYNILFHWGRCLPMRKLHFLNMQSIFVDPLRFLSIFGRRADRKVHLRIKASKKLSLIILS